MLFFLRRIGKFVLKHRPTAWFIAVAVVVAVLYGTVGFHLLEPDNTWGEAFYWTITTMSTVGYGDFSPVTMLGRIHAMGLMVMGIGIFGLVVEGFLSILLEVSERRKTGLIKVKDKGHILLCGWSETVRECVLELETMGDDVYVLGTDPTIREELEKLDTHAIFVKGDPTRWEDLKRGGAESAAVIIVDLPTDSAALDCVITLRDRTSARIVVEVERAENQQKFKNAGADELTIPFVLSGRLMAQSKAKRFLTRFVTEVVSTSVGMSLEEVPVEDGDALAGKSLQELSGPEYLPDKYVVAVGRGSDLLMDTTGKLVVEANDRIICLKQDGDQRGQTSAS